MWLFISDVKIGKLGEIVLLFREIWLLLCIRGLPVGEVSDGGLIWRECMSLVPPPGMAGIGSDDLSGSVVFHRIFEISIHVITGLPSSVRCPDVQENYL